MSDLASDSTQQIELLKKECANLLCELRNFHKADANNHYPDTYRLLVTPMLYSVWERCFTLCHAIALRLIRDSTKSAQALSPTERAVWLLHTPFYNSLVYKLKNQGVSEEGKKLKRGHFAALCDFLTQLDSWTAGKLDQSIDTDTLVMTFSNVNPDVVNLNAKAIGIDKGIPFQQIKLGRLNDLLGHRNGIGHGSIIKAPPNEEFNALWKLTDD